MKQEHLCHKEVIGDLAKKQIDPITALTSDHLSNIIIIMKNRSKNTGFEYSNTIKLDVNECQVNQPFVGGLLL